MHILVVEDEKDLNKLIKKKLEEENYVVDSCYDGQSALEYLTLAEYDGAILDVMIPYKNGFEVLKEIRKKGIQTPVMFLTAKSETKDIVGGLDSGADDYMVKPFEFSELLARLRVMLRKQSGVKENIYRCGDLEVNVNDRTVRRAGKDINVSAKEFSVVSAMTSPIEMRQIIIAKKIFFISHHLFDILQNHRLQDKLADT